MQFPLQSEKKSCWFPTNSVEEPKWVRLVELNPILCQHFSVKLHHFPPIFRWVKNVKTRIFEVSPHSNWLASPHFLGKKSFSRETFPKVRFHFELPGKTWDPVRGGPELTWKPWVNGPILVGEEATDPTIPNPNLKGSLVDLKVGTLMVNIAVNGMFFDLLDSTCPNFQRWFLGF